MPRDTYRIITYKIDDAPSHGFYEKHRDVAAEMATTLQRMSGAGTTEMPIPNIDGAVVSGKRIGEGYEMQARVATAAGTDQPHIAVFLAIDEVSSDHARKRAIEMVKDFSFPKKMINDEWLNAMKNGCDTPFTVVVPNYSAMKEIAAEPDALMDFRTLTGFFQNLIGVALAQSGLASTPYIEGGADHDDTPDGVDMAIALQTRGEPANVLIVSPGEDEFPVLKAHIMDVEVDVFTVIFNIDDTVHIDTEGFSYLALDRHNLQTMLDLQNEAADVWERALEILDDLDEDERADRSKGDPLAHLYTRQRTTEVPDELAAAFKTHLGIGPKDPPYE
jgi:hypothetical protein